MGGLGSGWQGSKKITVEASLSLSMPALLRKKALVAGAWTSGSWAWTYEGAERPHARLGYEANLVDLADSWLRLRYEVRGEAVDYKVRLVTTRPTYGGLRWWFVCPLRRPEGGPARRAGKLYLPPGGRYFGSRDAYTLTYTSCHESRKYDGLYRRLAADMGIDTGLVRHALKQR